MAATVARLQAVLSADTRDFDKGMDKSHSTMGKVGKAAGALGLAMAAGLAVGAKHAINDASNLNEQMNKTLVVFGKSGKEVQEWSKHLARNFGVSSRAALEAAGTFGNMLVPMGVARKQAAGMSKNMVQLAGDMASFNNADPSEVLEAIRSGLANQTEPLRKFGVFLSEDTIKAEALASGLVKASVSMADVHMRQVAVTASRNALTEATKKYGVGSLEAETAQAKLEYAEKKLHEVLAGKVPQLTAAQKATASYQLITKQTSDAQGDFQRTSGGLANQQRILKAEMENLSAELGAHLLPVVIAVMGKILLATEFFQKHKTATKLLVAATVALAAALVTAAAAQAAMNLAVLANPYVAATVAIIALGVGVAILYKRFKELRPLLEFAMETFVGLPLPLRLLVAALGGISGTVHKLNGVFQRLKNLLSDIKDLFQWIIDNAKKLGGLLGGITSAVGKVNPFGDADANKFKSMLSGGGSGPKSVSPALYDELSGARIMGLTLTSGYRKGAVTKHGTKSDHAYYPSKAIDVAGAPANMARFFRWLIGQTDVKQAFYDPLGSIFGGALSSYREGGHSDHVHVATYDRGGFLQPGWNLAYNGLGRPEAVGGNMVFNFPNYVGSKPELMAWLQNAAAEFRRRNGRSAF